MRWTIILWMLAVALPPALALECARAPLALQEDCENIMYSDMTMTDKNKALGALLSGDSWSPSHGTALGWNSEVLEDYAGMAAPLGVETDSKGSIQDAWVKLLGLHPSVQDGETLSHNGEGVALLAHGYSLRPHTGGLRGDCKTEYRPQTPIESLTLLVNGDPVGKGAKVPYLTYGDGIFTAELEVSQTTFVDGYDSETYCCKQKTVCGWFCSTYCVAYCERCVFRSTETRVDRVVIEDSIEAKLYTHESSASLTPTQQYGNTVRAVFTHDPDANTGLEAEDNHKAQGTIYSTELSQDALGTLKVRAKHLDSPANQTVFLHEDTDCTLEVQDHFGIIDLPCSTVFSGPNLKLTTDRTFYRPGEKILLTIYPDDLEAEVEYGDQQLTGKGTMSLEAALHQPSITARVADQEVYATVAVANPIPWITMVKVLVLLLLFTGAYTSLRDFGRRRGLWRAR